MNVSPADADHTTTVARGEATHALTPGPADAGLPTVTAGPGLRHIRVVDRPAETVGARIARLRLAQGWTQEDLALEACLSQSTISRTEAGARGLSAYALHALAETLGVSMDDIWLGEEDADEDEDDAAPAPSGHVNCPAVLGCREGRLPAGWVRERKDGAA